MSNTAAGIPYEGTDCTLGEAVEAVRAVRAATTAPRCPVCGAEMEPIADEPDDNEWSWHCPSCGENVDANT